jgi:hypothetical protein
MLHERVIMSRGEAEKNDSLHFSSEDGSMSVLADLIRIQEIPSKSNNKSTIPYRAQGPLEVRGQLWYFQAFNDVRALSGTKGWWFHQLIHPDEFVELINTDPYTDEDKERFRSNYPEITGSGYDRETRPSLDERDWLVKALEKAVEIQSKK